MQDLPEHAEVSTAIAAPPDTVWSLVSDVTRMGEWSPENEGATWRGGATGPTVGAQFIGRNRHGARAWSTRCRVTEATPGRAFAFHVAAGPFRVAEWRYEIEPTSAGCVVTESFVDRRGAIMHFLGRTATGVHDRVAHNEATMRTTLERLKAAAEHRTA